MGKRKKPPEQEHDWGLVLKCGSCRFFRDRKGGQVAVTTGGEQAPSQTQGEIIYLHPSATITIIGNCAHMPVVVGGRVSCFHMPMDMCMLVAANFRMRVMMELFAPARGGDDNEEQCQL